MAARVRDTPARAWMFTLNNPAFPLAELPVHPLERYLVAQLEVGANGTPHFQGYVEFSQPVRFRALLEWLPGAHFEKRGGTREQAREYCTKEETRDPNPDSVLERGDWGRGGQGKRTDLADACDVLVKRGLRAVAEEHPTAFVKFSRGLRDLQNMLEDVPRDDDFVPRPWQAHTLDFLAGPPDDRHIVWVTDTRGGNGKSRLAHHLVRSHGATLLEGKVADMAYMYNRERIVIIDIARCVCENVRHLYAFAEKLKNGQLVSTKYESKLKVFDPPHVIFFSNTSWEREFWTNDRVIEVDLNNPDWHDYPDIL